MLLKPKKKIVPTTDYQVPTYRLKKWNTYFNEKSKVTILTYIHMISYEYEYFGSARTPATESSTNYHTASLFCFMQDRSIPRSLQRWVSMKYSISQLTFLNFIVIAIEKPYTTDYPYTRERMMSSVSPYSSTLWVKATISIMACVQQMVPETR